MTMMRTTAPRLSLPSADDLPLQVTIGAPDGLDIGTLIAAIEVAYRTPAGQPVRVHVGRGVSDGLPPGMLYLVGVKQS